jgi:hypothetical protein
MSGVAIYVEPLAAEVMEKGITDGVLAAEVERRLRQAGVEVFNIESPKPAPGDPVLYLTVDFLIDEHIGQFFYAIRLELTQSVHLERDDGVPVLHAPTWSVGGVGVYNKGWRAAIVEDVLAFSDDFIDAYFAANPVQN